MRVAPFAVFCRFCLLGLLLAGRVAGGQALLERDPDLEDLPVSEIRLEGATPATEGLIWNNVRLAVGDPYGAQTVREDLSRIYNLGKFGVLRAEAERALDGSVIVIYTVTVQPEILSMQTVGNRAISDQELKAAIPPMTGLARDDYLIQKAERDIEALYRKNGYYLTEVKVDVSELEERGVLIFQIVEGARVRVKAIEFVGADSFNPKQLRGEIKTRTYIFVFNKGVLDENLLQEDVAALDRFYKDHGYIDVRVDRTIELSLDYREAKVVFVIAEGRQYTLGRVRAQRPGPGLMGQPLKVFSQEQIAALLDLKAGDVFSRDRLRRSEESIRRAYSTLGYMAVDAPGQFRGLRINIEEVRTGTEPVVDLLLQIDEGRKYKVGNISISGNFLTKDKVIRRELSFDSGRPLDYSEIEESERRLRRSRLFNDVRITIQEQDEDDPEYRDVLVEVKERNTGSVNFGVAVGSDAGLFGELALNQTNFDIADFPASAQELLTGRAFRGAGQTFNTAIRPGNEIFQYVISLTEPRFLDTEFAVTGSGQFRRRRFEQYDEQRLGGTLSASRRLGDIWQIGFRVRAQRVELTDISPSAPLAVFADAGPENLFPFGITLTRTTIGSFSRPGRGSRLELSLDRYEGDQRFFRLEGAYTVYLTLDEDFLGRKSILKLSSRLGYIFAEDDRAPTYERFYLGGRSFRGFEFRTISPKGIEADTLEPGTDPVGGSWLIFLGAQYDVPIFEELITGVVFVDTGTVTNSPGFDDYRVAVGVGVRLHIAQLGPVPIAFDFGFPIIKDDRDEEQVLSFSAELPF